MRKYLWIAILMGLVLSCQTKPENYVAKVGKLAISQQEFRHQYQFNPYLFKYKNPVRAKNIILNTLIAEKMLAQEGEKNLTLSDTLEKIIDHHLREAMIEKYRMDRVENTVQVSKQDLQAEYNRSLRQLHINYITFESSAEAQALKTEIDQGSSFEESVTKYMSKKGWQQAIPERRVNWGVEPINAAQPLVVRYHCDIGLGLYVVYKEY